MVELLDVTTPRFRAWATRQPPKPVVVLKWVLCHLSAAECARLVRSLLDRQAVIFVVDSVERKGYEPESRGTYKKLPFYHRTQQGWGAIWTQCGFSNTTPVWTLDDPPYAPQGIFRITAWGKHLKEVVPPGRSVRTRAATAGEDGGAPNKRRQKQVEKGVHRDAERKRTGV